MGLFSSAGTRFVTYKSNGHRKSGVRCFWQGLQGLEFAPRKHSRTARLERFALLLVFSPHRLAFSCHRQRQGASPRHARVPRISFISYKSNGRRKSGVRCFGRGFKDLTEGAAHLLFARRPKFSRISVPASRFWLKTILRIVFLTPKPSRVQVLFFYNKNKKSRKLRLFLSLAGAEGLEPSARGFGDRCSTN